MDMCGCCEGIGQLVPAIENRPGLSEIAYRAGTWAQFKSAMLDRLSMPEGLAALRTRDDDDFTIALCDAFAVVCDILTFYYERSANEHYLRTATELISVTALAGLIGYQPAPGVAASAALAFTLDAPPPALPQKLQPPQPALVPTQISLPAGTKVQSVPGPGQVPATFETSSTLAARYGWNALSPRLYSNYANDSGNTFPSHLRLEGLLGTLAAGDYVLIVVTVDGSPNIGLNRVNSVTQDPATQTTIVTFEPQPSRTQEPALQADPVRFGVTLNGDPDASTIASKVMQVTWPDQIDFVAQAKKLHWDIDLAQSVINAQQQQPAAPFQVFKLGVRASVFGHNAPHYYTLPSYTPIDAHHPFPGNWENDTLYDLNLNFNGNDDARVYLDTVYNALTVGTWVVLLQDGAWTPAQVTGARTLTLADFLLASTVTELKLNIDVSNLNSYYMRQTLVLGATDVFVPAYEFLDRTTVAGSLITLDSAQLELQTGQDVIISGTSATRTGQTNTELRSIVGLSLVAGRTQVLLDNPLDDSYVWNSVTINANVAPATHGESTSQILGSGDATVPNARFALNQLPVTYVSANTPSTIASTLAVRVNGELWTEVPYLYGHGPAERVFVTRLDVNGARYVEFGDGFENGARLPTGSNNVVAQYRYGLGSSGNVGAAQISTLLSRPLGLRSAINPLPGSGGGDPETTADTRATAPITVRALDRIVSLDDYADFARASAAIAKAAATWAWDGHRQVVCVTVAGPGGITLVPETPQYTNLLAAIIGAGDGTIPVALRSFVPRTFTVGATLAVDPALDPDAVVANAKAALQAAYGFGARDFMQPVFRSEVIETLQGVNGVVALTLDRFRYNDRLISEWFTHDAEALTAAAPRIVGGQLTGAELLTIDAGPLPNVVHA